MAIKVSVPPQAPIITFTWISPLGLPQYIAKNLSSIIILLRILREWPNLSRQNFTRWSHLSCFRSFSIYPVGEKIWWRAAHDFNCPPYISQADVHLADTLVW